jgi:glycopeptide antibiotics resistance protein
MLMVFVKCLILCSKIVCMQNQNNQQDNHSSSLLGTALFAYMMIIILVITLAPFRYHLPQKYGLIWFWNYKEVLQNVFLFMPFGFLLHTIFGKNSPYYLFKVLLAGMLLSVFVELNQIFIYRRMTSLIDVAANASGAFLGALFYIGLKKRLSNISGKIILEIPLMNLLFLLIPLLWLSGLAIGNEVQRVVLFLPLGLMGALLISDVFHNRAQNQNVINKALFVLLFLGWFITGSLPALLEFPKTILLFSAVLGMFVLLFIFVPKKKLQADTRFELRSLKKIVPVYFFYLILLNRWPIKLFSFNYDFAFVPPDLFSNSDLDFIIRTIQLFSSFTIVGYILYQYLNRAHPTHTVTKLIVSLLIIALVIELPRGFHPSQQAAFINVFFDFFWGLFGALIYILQLHYFKVLQAAQEEETLHLDFASKSVVKQKRAS